MPLRPLETANFHGDFNAAPGAVADGGQATYSGHVFVVMLPREIVRAVIPTHFELAPRTDAGTEHPVMCLLGTQADCRLVVGGQVEDSAQDDYEELIVLVPFVVRIGSTRPWWHNFCVRMYLDQFAPIVIGDFLFQYSKGVGTFSQIPYGEEVRDEKGVLAFTCLFDDTSPFAAAKNAMPGFADFKQVMRMPILGIQYGGIGTLPPPPPPPPPAYQCSYFEFDDSAAQVRTIESALCFTGAYRPGMSDWVTQPPNWRIPKPDASFGVENMRWRLATARPACVF